MEQARHSIHLNDVLDVLLFQKTLLSYLNFLLSKGPGLDPLAPIKALFQATTKVDEVPVEVIGEVVSAKVPT